MLRHEAYTAHGLPLPLSIPVGVASSSTPRASHTNRSSFEWMDGFAAYVRQRGSISTNPQGSTRKWKSWLADRIRRAWTPPEQLRNHAAMLCCANRQFIRVLQW